MTSVVLTTADLRPIMSVVIEVSAPLEVTCRGSKPIHYTATAAAAAVVCQPKAKAKRNGAKKVDSSH